MTKNFTRKTKKLIPSPYVSKMVLKYVIPKIIYSFLGPIPSCIVGLAMIIL
jgi:hypothetical protein